jgi:hypothetical protein
MVGIAAVIALLLFIYVNRSIQNRRENKRNSMNDRREASMEHFFRSKKKEAADKEEETGKR